MKKKVAVIHPEAGFSSSGGSQLSAYEMAEHLAKFFNTFSTLTCVKRLVDEAAFHWKCMNGRIAESSG